MVDRKLLFDSASFSLTVERLVFERDEKCSLAQMRKAGFLCLEEGDLSFFFDRNTVPLLSGACLFVNPMRPLSLRSNAPSRLTALYFDMTIAGSGLVREKYIGPLLGAAFDYAVLSPSGAQALCNALSVFEEGAFGCELRLLSGILESLSIVVYERQAALESGPRMDERLSRMLEYMKTHLDCRLRLGDIAAAGYVSTREASRLFERHLSSSVMKYFMFLRLEKARSLIEEGVENMGRICLETGFESVSHFSTCFRRMYAESPSEYRQRCRGR